MSQCMVCGCETPNRLTCSKHTRLNIQWKSCNNWRRKHQRPELTFHEYLQNRKSNSKSNAKPRMFEAEDCAGPTVIWDGHDGPPCEQGCAHQFKDKNRFGCAIKCQERHKYAISHGPYQVQSHYSQLDLTAVVCSRR